MAQNKTIKLVATGKDPLGRHRLGENITADTDEAAALLAAGYAVHPPPKVLVGTGADPLGRYPYGERVEVDDDEAIRIVALGFAVDPALVPTPPRVPDTPQDTDERGRAVLDRPFTAAEAHAIDAHHQQVQDQNRRTRFGVPVSPPREA